MIYSLIAPILMCWTIFALMILIPLDIEKVPYPKKIVIFFIMGPIAFIFYLFMRLADFISDKIKNWVEE